MFDHRCCNLSGRNPCLSFQSLTLQMISGQGFTSDNTAASLQNRAWACQEGAGSRRAAPAVPGPSHSQGLSRSEGLSENARARRQTGGGEPRCTGEGLGHSPNVEAAEAVAVPAAPKTLPTGLKTLNRPRCYVSQGQRTVSGARLLAQARWQILFSTLGNLGRGRGNLI